jgi:hypothetical protein
VACKNGNMNQQASVDADGWWCWPMAHHQKGWVWLGRSFVLRLNAGNLSGEQELSMLFSKSGGPKVLVSQAFWWTCLSLTIGIPMLYFQLTSGQYLHGTQGHL